MIRVSLIASSYIGFNDAEARGGGLWAEQTSTSITNTSITGNDAILDGGVYAEDGSIDIYDTTVSNNRAVERGGGLHLASSAIAEIKNSTIAGNEAYTDGGGVSTTYASVTLENCSISGNTADKNGGAISSIGNDRELRIAHCTITGNTATQCGGGLDIGPVYTSYRTVVLNENIISGNIAASGSEVYFGGGSYNPFTPRYNVQGHAGVTDAQAFLGFSPRGNDIKATSNGTNTPLGLILNTTLADNGGPTQTHMLPYGSPAIDAADVSCPPPATDQRGENRPVDGDDSGTAECDIGAVEYDPSTADSDADGMTDAYEIDNELNPNLADASDDRDMDGVSNGDEFDDGTAANDPDSDGLGDAIDRMPLAASNDCTDDVMGPDGAKEFDDTAMSGVTTQCGSESQITVRGTAILEIPDARLELFAPNVIFDTEFNVPLGTELKVDSGNPTPP